jgi:hypothetical protein
MTYWQPVPEGIDLPAQWWLNLDLGRFVFAKKIVLKFVDEEMGDPFLLFDVLVSDGFKPKLSPLSATPNYTTVMRLLQENKTQRVFEIDLQEADEETQSMGLRLCRPRRANRREWAKSAASGRGRRNAHRASTAQALRRHSPANQSSGRRCRPSPSGWSCARREFPARLQSDACRMTTLVP